MLTFFDDSQLGVCRIEEPPDLILSVTSRCYSDDHLPLSLASLGGWDRRAAAIDAQRQRVEDDEDAFGPCEGGPDVGACSALGQQ